MQNRDKCIEKETKTTNKKEDYVYKVKKDEEKIEELNDKKDQLEEDITTITVLSCGATPSILRACAPCTAIACPTPWFAHPTPRSPIPSCRLPILQRGYSSYNHFEGRLS